MDILANSARTLYDGGQPQPGQRTRNDPGEVVLAGYAGATIPFGRLVGPFTLQSDNNKLFPLLTSSHTKSDGVAVFSFDAVSSLPTLQYASGEVMGVINRGNVVMECHESLALDNTALTVVNDASSAGLDADLGKLSQMTGTGFSTVTGIRLVKKISATLVEVKIDGVITLAAG